MGHRSIANTVIYTAVADKRLRAYLGSLSLGNSVIGPQHGWHRVPISRLRTAPAATAAAHAVRSVAPWFSKSSESE
jgi:hypothetical protein